MLFAISQWLPDLPRANNPGEVVALNVLPAKTSYIPFPNMTVAATNLNVGQTYGATFGRDNANNTYVYVGDQSALYRLAGLSLTAATRLSGGAYATDITEGWEFVNWGQTVIAVNGQDADVPQQISFGAANFVNLGGGSFPAAHIAVINNFVVMGNISDSATQVQRVRWSAINNSGSWTQDATTLADFQDLVGEGGWIQKVTSGDQGGFVFQERAIWSMVFVGSPLIFQFTKLIDGLGAYAANSVCYFENTAFFLSNDGFKKFDGSNISDIGEGRVDNFFLNDLDTGYLGQVRGVVVPELKTVMWLYPGAGHFGSKCNRIIAYSYAFDKWSLLQFANEFSANIEILFRTSTPGYTLDGLDAVSTNLDLLPFSLDSREWTGGQLVLAGFINGWLTYFNGPPLNATIETGETDLAGATAQVQIQQKKAVVANRFQVNEIWPLVGSASLSALVVSMKFRDTLGSTPDQTTPMNPISTGFVQAHTTTRYVSFVLSTSGSFADIQGFDVDFVNAGRR